MNVTIRRHLIPIAAMALLAVAGSVQAQSPPDETPAPTPQPLLEAPDIPLPPRPAHFPKSRRITNFTTGTNSQCIGDATTPRCAIDTYIAWWVRGDPSLDWVAPNFPSASPVVFGGMPPWRISDHTILYLGPVRKSKMPSDLEWHPAPRTLLAVIVPIRCMLRRDIAEKDWDCYFLNGGDHRRYLLLKLRANRWVVDDTFSPKI